MKKKTLPTSLKKKTVLVLSALLLMMVSVLVLAKRNDSAASVTYVQQKYSQDGKPVLVVAYDGDSVVNYVVMTFEELEQNEGRFTMNYGGVRVSPGVPRSESGVILLDFRISDHGVGREISDFIYSGEDAITVDRGYNWYIQITTL